MVRKLLTPLVFFLLLISSLPLIAEGDTVLEFRTGAFFHSSHRFREIYGTVGPTFQVQATSALNSYLDGFVNVDWFSQKGRSTFFNEKTTVQIANLSLGILYPYRFTERVTAYGGIGASFSRIVLRNHIRSGRRDRIESNTRGPVGGVFKSGLLYLIDCDFILDIFVDYLYQPVQYDTFVNIGGFKLGAGIGYKF